MKNKRKAIKKKRLTLPEDLEKRLAVYALAAGAAGVGLAATAQPAQANIYTYTPNPALTVNTNGFVPLTGTFVSSQGANSLKSFSFLEFYRGPGGVLAVESGVGGNVMVHGTADAYPLVQKLSAGAAIGPAGSFSGFGLLEAQSSSGFIGNWTGTRPGYLGFDLVGSKGTYFGWAKVSNSVTANGGPGVVTVLEAAIDMTAGQSIKAGQTSRSVPEPGTLSLLALGAVGLLALRKKRQAAVEHESAANG